MWPFSAIAEKKEQKCMKENKIRRNSEFRTVYRRGKSFYNNLLVLYIYRNNSVKNRVGISVSKKVGKSVIRNRVKRLIGESYRHNCNNLKNGYDLVFIARNASKEKNYKDMENSLVNLLNKAGLYKHEKTPY